MRSVTKAWAAAALAVLLILGQAAAQTTGKIAGRVTDENDEAIVGANVLVKGLRTGASSDLDGYFFIVNVPVGTYTVTASALGHQTVDIERVKVRPGMTTRLDFTLRTSAVMLEEVTVTYEAPQIQVDRTFKVQELDVGELRTMPVVDISQALELQAGVTRNIETTPVSSRPVFGQFATIPTDGFHFRGGREGEANFYFDGVPVRDDLWGGFDIQALSAEGLDNLTVYSGTFGPEFGDAMSGVMLFNTLSRPERTYRWRLTGQTDRVGGKTGPGGGSDDTWQGEASLSGPVPMVNNLTFALSSRLYSTDGYLYGYIYPNYVDSEGADKSGDPEVVPMQFYDVTFNTGKLLYQPRKNMRLSLGGFYGHTNRGLYSHFFKYNPYGTPQVELDQNLGYIKLNHAISDRTYYNITLSRYDRIFLSRVYDNLADYLTIPQNSTGEFSISGEDWVYFESRYLRSGGSLELATQADDRNLVRFGATYDEALTKLRRLNPDGFSEIEDYSYIPFKASAYLADKMEFNSIGMILNIGLRADYIDPNRSFPADLTNTQDVSTVKDVDPSFFLSPRIGISYPVSDKAAFRFGYGHYYQYPNFYKVYQGANLKYPNYPSPNIYSVTGAIAAGDIKEERTINYEAGLQARLSDVLKLDLTGFYRKTSDLIGTLVVEDRSGARFPALDNINYATVKGIELTLRKSFSSSFSAFINYTFSQTLVSSSLLFEQPTDVSRTFLADWDQPHVFSGSVAFRFPSEWGFTLNGGLSSGFPYTFNAFAPNEERGPMQINLDVYAYKDFGFFGLKERLFLQVNNLINRPNVWWVYADSGKPGEDASPATSYDYTNNPAMWGPGRRIQVGLSLWAQ